MAACPSMTASSYSLVGVDRQSSQLARNQLNTHFNVVNTWIVSCITSYASPDLISLHCRPHLCISLLDTDSISLICSGLSKKLIKVFLPTEDMTVSSRKINLTLPPLPGGLPFCKLASLPSALLQELLQHISPIPLYVLSLLVNAIPYV